MNFNNLVLSILNESPDNLLFQGEQFKFDNAKGKPITFTIDHLMYTKGDDKKRKTNLGMVLVYFTPVPDNQWVSHRGLQEILSELNYRQLKKTKAVHFFSPSLNAEDRLDQMFKTYPNMTVTTNKDSWDVAAANQGRLWKHKDKVIIALWGRNKKIIEEYVIPFAQHVYPNTPLENIYIQQSVTHPGKFYSADSQQTNKPTSQNKPYQKELTNLQRQLHLASGDEKKRQKIRNQIKEIALKYNLDPKKYGIDDEVLKGSQLTAQKLLNPKSKETMASLRARTTQSESKQVN